MESGTFYITTPIYYPDAELHIGHAYTTVAADALARFWRLRGRDVWFLTGTDEHGQKLQRAAAETGQEPQAFVDAAAERIRQLWSRLEIRYDDFVRTTEPRHHRAVQHIMDTIKAQGDIYRDDYEGWYCTPCESFWLERQLNEQCCPDCGRSVERVKEQSYFFRMSKYADQLLDHIERHPEFIQPVSRRNEMVSFIKSGLEDLCVSRTTFSWGIPVSFDRDHVIYVWFDALTNYISALGWPEDTDLYQKFWPADVHLVGKEIVRFHTIIWPAMLLAAGLPLPRTIFGHGWLVLEGSKISKSLGNVIDPNVLVEKYGSDAVRYFLLREIPFGADTNYTERALVERTNVDLANDLGNLLHRTVSMISRFTDGVIEEPGPEQELDRELRAVADRAVSRAAKHMEQLVISDALTALWQLVGRCNKYIDETAPWGLAKDPDARPRLTRVLYNLAESLRILACSLQPFLTVAPGLIWDRLGLTGQVQDQTWDDATRWGALPAGIRVRPGDPIFPRLDVDVVLGVEGGRDDNE